MSVASKNAVEQMEKNKGNIDDVYFAKLAKQAERYDEMAERMRNIGNVGSPLFVKERNLLSVASKNAVGSRRPWRIITSVKQKGRSRGNNDNVYFAKLAEQAERYDELLPSRLCFALTLADLMVRRSRSSPWHQ